MPNRSVAKVVCSSHCRSAGTLPRRTVLEKSGCTCAAREDGLFSEDQFHAMFGQWGGSAGHVVEKEDGTRRDSHPCGALIIDIAQLHSLLQGRKVAHQIIEPIARKGNRGVCRGSRERLAERENLWREHLLERIRPIFRLLFRTLVLDKERGKV